MAKKQNQKNEIRIGSFTDREVFEIDLTKISTAFMSSYLGRPDVRFLTLKDEDQ